MDKQQLEQVWKRHSMDYEWVIARYKGSTAKKVKELADSGVGYTVRMERGAGQAYELEVAFRRAIDGPTPHNLTLADSTQVRHLEKMYNGKFMSTN